MLNLRRRGMLNLTRIFYSSTENTDALHAELIPENEQRTFLRSCRTKIKNHLKSTIAEATVKVLGMQKRVEPRFRTQGSWAYETCIQPAHPSIQEMDLDYGVYLPVDVWRENGPPAEMAKVYFDLVETQLQILCALEQWELVKDDNEKDTCIRIKVATWAHIDIPLYAAPAEDFAKVVETVLLKTNARALNSINGSMAMDSMEQLLYKGQTWDDLDQIMMATRKGEWKASDPEMVAKWFRDQIIRFGELGDQFLRVCRYIKAWRDYNWKDGGPTSVSLMIAIAQKFEGKKGRDDIALEEAANIVSQAIRKGIYEPGIDNGGEDFNRLSPESRIEAGLVADRLADTLSSARGSTIDKCTEIPYSLRRVLGSRVPLDAELIKEETPASIVRRTAPAIVAAPYVPNTSAG